MPLTDDFTGADGTSLPAYGNWEIIYGIDADFQLLANGVVGGPTATPDSWACQRTEAFPADQYAQVAFPIMGATWFGPAVRCQGAGSGSYYGIDVSASSSPMFELSGGVQTLLGSPGAGFVTNDILRIDATGTTITPTKNGSQTGTPGAQTDATFAGGSVGLCAYQYLVTVGDTTADSFESTNAISIAKVVLLGF